MATINLPEPVQRAMTAAMQSTAIPKLSKEYPVMVATYEKLVTMETLSILGFSENSARLMIKNTKGPVRSRLLKIFVEGHQDD